MGERVGALLGVLRPIFLGVPMVVRTLLSNDGVFEFWSRERARTIEFYVVHIETGRYLHTDGRLHSVRQYFGALRYAARAVGKWNVGVQ